MADTLTPQERSERMALIRSSNTKPEILARKALHRLGLRYRVNNKNLQGKPDMVFPKYGVAVFVHGCFWHCHAGCKISNLPKSNTAFWKNKFDRNVERDQLVKDVLEASGWRVEVVWECQLTPRLLEQTIHRLYESIVGKPCRK